MPDLPSARKYQPLPQHDAGGGGGGRDEELASRRRSLVKVLLAVGASLSWMVVSTLLILINKHIMVDLGFHYPMTVSGAGRRPAAAAAG